VTGRDDARTHPTHPTVDELADLREGLLSGADEARVRAHLAGCADCAAETAALAEVAAVLREAGSEPLTMPTSVARAIDDALSDEAAARASAPAPEPAVRHERPAGRRAWIKPAFGWLAAAAAAVVVIGGVGAGLRGPDNEDNSAGGSSAAADSGGLQERSGGRDGVTPTSGGRAPRRLDEQSIRTYAKELSADGALGAAPQANTGDAAGSAAERHACNPQGIGGLRQPVVWDGRLAMLVVRREVRVASIYTCDATPRRLYSARY
jgi:hypothetical protein